MKHLKDLTWKRVFEGWRSREETNPSWVTFAKEEKGFPDWESWRLNYISRFHPETMDWRLYQFEDPLNEIPEMLLGPYFGWQSLVQNKHNTTFAELMEQNEQYTHFQSYPAVAGMLESLPFKTEMIGFMRTDGRIVCIDGHHRSAAVAISKKEERELDFSNTPVTIALAKLNEEQERLFDEIVNE